MHRSAKTIEQHTYQRLRSQRMFYVDPVDDEDDVDDGWYFAVRGNRIFGPYDDKATAQICLDSLVAEYCSTSNSYSRHN